LRDDAVPVSAPPDDKIAIWATAPLAVAASSYDVARDNSRIACWSTDLHKVPPFQSAPDCSF
jgi:hypothetical protein